MHLFFKYISFLSITSLLSVIVLHAQGVSFPVTNIIEPLSFSRIGVSEWASGGVRTVEVGSPSAAFNNPALLRAQILSVYVEFGKRTETEYYIPELKYDGQYLLPNFGMIATQLDDFTVALGYASMYDEYQYSEFQATTVEQPDGTGEVIEATTSEIVHSITASASYSFDNILSLGLTSGLNIVAKRDQIFHTQAEGSGTGVNLILGFYFHPMESFHMGGTVRYSNGISYTTKMEGPVLNRQVDIDSGMAGNNPNINAQLTTNEYPYIAKFPLMIAAGFRFDVAYEFSLLVEAELAKWYDIDSYRYNNTINTHVGFIFRPLQSVKLRGGYFTQNDPGKLTSHWPLLDQQFWTTGVEVEVMHGATFSVSTVQSFYSKTRIAGFIPLYRQIVNQDLFLAGIQYQL